MIQMTVKPYTQSWSLEETLKIDELMKEKIYLEKQSEKVVKELRDLIYKPEKGENYA